IVFEKKNLVAIRADYDHWDNVQNLSKGGFVAPSGFNGCAKIDRNTVFHQWQERRTYDDLYQLRSKKRGSRNLGSRVQRRPGPPHHGHHQQKEDHHERCAGGKIRDGEH
ncbi:hypothetical protein PMAYCL1PPCAC_08793, partial [Pristionchus mayeri]